MSDGNRQVFRSDALRRYAESRDKAVLLHIIRPRLFGLLWGLLALLVVLVGILCTTRVPVYATGVAVVVAPRDDSKSTDHELAWAVFFPVEQAPALAPGQQVYIRWDTAHPPQIASLRSAPAAVLSPAAARQQFALQGAAAAVAEPSHFGLAPFEPPDSKAAAATYLGSVRPCQTEVGSRTALSLLPFVGSGAD